MKIRYLKLKDWLLVSLAGMLGIPVACDKPIFVEEYGCPAATYHVKGTVTNEQGQPIAGVGVSQIKSWDDAGDSLSIEGYRDTTDADGRFSVDYEYAFPSEPLSLDVHDIDGAENGSYNDTTVTVNTENVPLHGGDGHWYDGDGVVNVDVIMSEKTNK